jgi:hypothetical protein
MTASGTKPTGTTPTETTTESSDKSWFQKLKDSITTEIDKLEALFEEKKSGNTAPEMEATHLNASKIETKTAVVNALNSIDANPPAAPQATNQTIPGGTPTKPAA